MKKLSAFLVLLTLLLASVTVLHADGEMTYGNALKDLKLISGGSKGELNADKFLKREELVVIINRLYREPWSRDKGSVVSFDSTKAYKDFVAPEKPSFKDVPKSHWAYRDVEFAYAKKLTNGVSKGVFGLGQSVNGNQAALFLMRSIGYKDMIDDEKVLYSTAYRQGRLLLDFDGINVWDNEADKPILRSDVFEMLFKSLLSKTPIGGFYYPLVFLDDDEKYTKLKEFQNLKSDIVIDEAHKKASANGTLNYSYFDSAEQIKSRLVAIKSNENTKGLNLSQFNDLKTYLALLNKNAGYTDETYLTTNSKAMIELIAVSNNFAKITNSVLDSEMKTISANEAKALFDGEFPSMKMLYFHEQFTQAPREEPVSLKLDFDNKQAVATYYALDTTKDDGSMVKEEVKIPIVDIQVPKNGTGKILVRIDNNPESGVSEPYYVAVKFDSATKKYKEAAVELPMFGYGYSINPQLNF